VSVTLIEIHIKFTRQIFIAGTPPTLSSCFIKAVREMWVRTYEGGELLAECLL